MLVLFAAFDIISEILNTVEKHHDNKSSDPLVIDRRWVPWMREIYTTTLTRFPQLAPDMSRVPCDDLQLACWRLEASLRSENPMELDPSKVAALAKVFEHVARRITAYIPPGTPKCDIAKLELRLMTDEETKKERLPMKFLTSFPTRDDASRTEQYYLLRYGRSLNDVERYVDYMMPNLGGAYPVCTAPLWC